MIKLVRLTVLATLACCILKANCQPEDKYSSSSDYRSIRNVIYDIAAASTQNQYDHGQGHGHHEHLHRDSVEVDPTENAISHYPKSQAASFPSRLSIKVEDDTSEFKACGGFSSGSAGTCCTACAKMNYRRGCWCRTWDCLCFNS